MKEYIEREAVHSIIEQTSTFAFTRGGMHEKIDSLPAADVAEVKHGRWIFDHMTGNWAYYAHCSECGLKKHFEDEEAEQKKKYCSFCGARMDKEDEHDKHTSDPV